MLLQSTNGKLETNFLHLKKWFIRKICDNTMFFWKKCGGKSPTCNSVHACSVAKSHPTQANSRTVARQTPLVMEFSRQKYWSGLPFPAL